MNKVVYVCSLATVLIFASCQSDKKAQLSLNELDQTSWKLVSLDNKANPAFQEGNLYTLNFVAADSTVNGVGACNRFFGKTVTDKDNQIDIQMGGTTMMACPNLDLESAFIKTLDEMTSMKIENGDLLMYKDNVQTAKFVPFTEIKDDGHYASNSLDYQGTYTGTFPAADCPGVNVTLTLTLNQNNTFLCTMDSIERNNKFNQEGSYVVDKNTLMLTAGKDTTYYKIGENRLMKLDNQGNPITEDLASKYELNKVIE